MLRTYTYCGNDYTNAAAGTTTFALTSTEGNAITYLQRAHIHVYISDDDGDTWVEQARPADWDFNAEGTSIVLEEGIEEGEWVRVLRITPILNRFVDFADGSLLTAAQLDQGEDYSRYSDQELFDRIASATAGSLIYQGNVDLTADPAPALPELGWVYINTGVGDVIQGGNPGWVGIVGDPVTGGEQVVYQADATWVILQTPASQAGVLEVTALDSNDNPVTVDNTDPQRPVISSDAVITVTGTGGINVDTATDPQRPAISLTGDGSDITSGIDLGYIAAPQNGVVTNTAGENATIPFATSTNAGLLNEAATPNSGTVQYARQVTDAGVATWAQVAIPPGTIIDNTEPADPADGQLWYRPSNSTLWIWDNGNDTWQPAMAPVPTGGGADYANGDLPNQVFLENQTTCTASYQLTAGRNAISAGPITVNDGVTITIPNSQNWVIV